MSAQPSDEALMVAYSKGDMNAFQTLYNRHKKSLYNFIARGISPRNRADECMQEVWVRVVDARHRYRPDARFSTWLYQIANNLLIDQYRRQRVHVSINDDDEPVELVDDDALPPEQEWSRFEQIRRIQRALEDLPEEQRIAIQLRFEQEFSHEHIAEITGVGRETVKSRLRYALDKLRARLSS